MTKEIFKNEMLSDEQLEGVAGGTRVIPRRLINRRHRRSDVRPRILVRPSEEPYYPQNPQD